MKRSWLLVLAIFWLRQASFSQSTIQLHIKNYETQEPVQGAFVKLNPTDFSFTSGPNGTVIFQNVKNGSYDFVITKDGFDRYEKQINIKDENISLEIFLSVKTYRVSPIEVNALRAVERFSPVTFSEIRSAEMQKEYFVQDVPELLSNLPSTTFYSENGNGIGYNYLSIRGFDQRRLAIMINGVPQNDPEDHDVYWLDFNDILASTENIQVQRGAGSAFYGPTAIGGSINIITGDFSNRKGIRLSSGAGAFNTQKYFFSYGSGMVDSTYSFYGHLSKTTSDGYRDRSWTNFNSYYLTASRYDKNMTTRLNFYGGPISDGLAYYGLPKFAIGNKKLRRSNYNYWETNNAGYTYTQSRRTQEIEEFSQPHYELLHEWKFSDNVTLNNSLFYVAGQGYFDYDGTGWTDSSYYRMTSQFGFSNVSNPMNPIIRAYVDNKQFGWLPRLTMHHDDGIFTTGLELRRHRSLHWGRIQWAENLPANYDPDRHYYEYHGGKDIISVYAQEMYKLSPQINFMTNVQYAFNRYFIYDEKFVGTDFKVDYHFINPRIGLNYNINENVNVYTNISYTSREPRLKNLYDAAESSGGAVPQFETNVSGQLDFSKPLVKPEQLLNFELGTGYQEQGLNILINAYLMNFTNEIIENGQLDRFGIPITGNAKHTQHVGIEISGVYSITKNLSFNLNGVISSNRLNDYTEYKDTSGVAYPISLNGNHIAGFPDYLANMKLTFHHEGFFGSLILKFIGPVYTDNYQTEANQVDAYTILNGNIGYRVSSFFGLRAVEFRLNGNNVLNRLYAAHGDGNQFFPAAERNFFFDFSLEL